jgi:hypothetical protein
VSKKIVLPVCCLLAALVPPRAPASPRASLGDAPDWLVEEASGVVRLSLAHAEEAGPDEGVLTVDPERRLVTWEGAPGDRGCRRQLQAAFSRVRAVREADGAMRLELKDEPLDQWRLVPLTDAARLAAEATADDEAAADVQLAVERVRRALGRPVLPTVAVYEALYGRPSDVPLAELLANPGAHQQEAVRVRGTVTLVAEGKDLELRDGEARVALRPQPEIAMLVRAASRAWKDREVHVTGVLGRVAASAEAHLLFWDYETPDAATASKGDAPEVSLRDVVERKDSLAGQTVRVVGRFRGNNLFRDLPGPAPRRGWVLKSRRHAVWVVGHDASGPGFRLDGQQEGDMTRWVEVTGVVEVKGGRALLRARSVALAAPATYVWSGPRRKAGPRPEVVFTLPLADEEAPVRAAPLLLQFNSYMDEESFEGRVRVRWGAGETPDRDAARARWTYDDSRRVLVVEPGQALRPGGTVEVQLLPGITDVHASTLEAPPGSAPDAPAIVQRWRVAGGPPSEDRGPSTSLVVR